MKQSTKIDSELQIKATASLRKEIIKELTQPDKSLSFLMENIDDKNNELCANRVGETGSTK